MPTRARTRPYHPPVSVVGAGKVGSAMSLALFASGFPIVSVIDLSPAKALALSKMLRSPMASSSLADLSSKTRMLLIAVPDSKIEEVSGELAHAKRVHWKRVFAFHTSGVLSSKILKKLSTKGAHTASIHPIQSFPDGIPFQTLRNRLKGIPFGIEGSTDAAIDRAHELVQTLEGKPIRIEAKLKPLYHAACIFASSAQVVLIDAIMRLAETVAPGATWTDLFGPLLTASTEHALKFGSGDALTGPILRKDMSTLTLHLNALWDSAPHLLPLYMASAIEVARISKASGKICQDDYKNVQEHFYQFLTSLRPVQHRRRTSS